MKNAGTWMAGKETLPVGRRTISLLRRHCPQICHRWPTMRTHRTSITSWCCWDLCMTKWATMNTHLVFHTQIVNFAWNSEFCRNVLKFRWNFEFCTKILDSAESFFGFGWNNLNSYVNTVFVYRISSDLPQQRPTFFDEALTRNLTLTATDH